MADDTNVAGTYLRRPVTIYGLTLVVVAVAAVVRWLLDPALVDLHPFVTFYVAVIVAAWLGGLRSALLAMGLGFVLALYLFVQPSYSIAIDGLDSRVGSVLYFVVCFAIAGFSELTRRAQRRAAEEREVLRVTLASIGDAVIATDTDGRIGFLNAVAESVTGWTRQEAVGMRLDGVFRIVNEQTRENVENPVLKALREGTIVGLANHTVLIAKDGTELAIDDSAAPIRDAAGRVLGAVLVFRDVTERRKVERAVRSLALIVESSDDAIIGKDVNGVITSWNKAAERIFGYSADQAIGSPVAMLEPAERSGEMATLLARLKQGERVEHFDTVRRAKDGRLVPISLTVSHIKDEDGEVVGASKTARDISERKRAEEALREEKARLHTTLVSIGDAVIVTDTASRVTMMNPAAQTLTGWNEEAIDQPLGDVFRIVNEQTRQPVENPVGRVIREGAVAGLANHTVLIDKDGNERPIDDSAAPIRDSNGKIIGCVLVFRDITQRRRAEQQFADDKARIQSIVDNVVDGIIAIDECGTVESFNFAAESLFGYTTNEVIGNNVNMLMPEPYHQAHDGYVADYLRTGQARIIGIGREVEGRRKDGSTFPMALAVSNFSLGNRRHFTGIVRDISDQKEAEKRVYDLLAELQAADMQKDVFLATLAHELRGPLAPLCNTVEILKRADGDAELLQQARGTIERQLSQMVRLVDDLLDVSRIARNKLELRKGRVELAFVLQQAVESNRPLAESFQHEVSVILPSEPIDLHADATRLIQVFSNLLNNACKYTEPGGRVWLSAERQGSDVVVSVRDTGVGIPRDKLNSIFELFTQVDRSLDRIQGGLGIGLSLVKRLVELHDGTVEASSDGPGLGSEFVVRLPRVVELHDTDKPIIATPQATARRVLIVDDNKDSAKSLALLLEISGNETYTAYDGLEAVEVAERTRPDLVLLDIGLPKLNGFDACRRIREQPWSGNAMMIALTGWGQDEDRRKAKEAGFDQLMVKPVEYMTLLKILAELAPMSDASRSSRVEFRASEIHVQQPPTN